MTNAVPAAKRAAAAEWSCRRGVSIDGSTKLLVPVAATPALFEMPGEFSARGFRQLAIHRPDQLVGRLVLLYATAGTTVAARNCAARSLRQIDSSVDGCRSSATSME